MGSPILRSHQPRKISRRYLRNARSAQPRFSLCVTAIVHTHPPYCSALSVTGQPLVAAHMDTAMFYDDCAYLADWPGPPIGDEEGRSIHEARGDKRAILLAPHAQLDATSTIEKAASLR